MDQWPPTEAQPLPELVFSSSENAQSRTESDNDQSQPLITQHSIASTASSDAPAIMSVAEFFKTPDLFQTAVDYEPPDLLKPGIFIIYSVQNNEVVRLFSVGAHDDVFCVVRTLLPSFGITPPAKRLVLCNIVTNALFLENNQPPDPRLWVGEFAAFVLLHL